MSKEKASTSEERLEELEEGTLHAPKDSELCLTLGEAFLRVNRVDEAAASYQRAVELDPRSDLKALYWEWLGLVREMEGRLEEALEAYFQWMDTDPVAISPLDHLGTLLVVLGRWTDLRLLRPQFERRIEVSGHPRGRESLALYTFVTEQFGQSETEEAKDVTLQALEADPDSPSMRFLLGLITYREGNFELSRGEFERVLDLDREGLWTEPRFALDWNASKARVMVAKLARQQGDTETALRLLVGADDLDKSDSEGLIEVAELLVENDRYDDLLKLTQYLSPGPSRLNRLEAEGLLGKGRLQEASALIETEAILFRPLEVEEEGAGDDIEVSHKLLSLWDRGQNGEIITEELAELRRQSPEAVSSDPVGACLILLSRENSGALDESGVERELDKLCRAFPDRVEVWETATRLHEAGARRNAAQMAALVASKLLHGAHPGPTGAYTTRARNGPRVLVAVVTDFGPVVLKLEADVGRNETDQLFGWGREGLLPGLALAKSVLLDLAERKTRELSFVPKSFRVMVTSVSVPKDVKTSELLADDELGSIPFGFLAALLSVVNPLLASQLLVLGRLGLKGGVDGVPELEETLLSVHQSGAEWEHLLLAEAGGFRLLRAPAWLWHGKDVTMVKSADELIEQAFKVNGEVDL